VPARAGQGVSSFHQEGSQTTAIFAFLPDQGGRGAGDFPSNIAFLPDLGDDFPSHIVVFPDTDTD